MEILFTGAIITSTIRACFVKFLSIYIKEQRLRFRALSNGMFLIVRVCLLCKIKRKMHKMPYHFPMCYLQSGLFTRQRLNV